MSIIDNPLTLDQIIDNSPIPVNVPGVGIIIVRRPKVKDNKNAKKKLMEMLHYDKLTEAEKEENFNIFLIQSIVVNPDISDIDEIDFAKFQAIFDVVSMWLTAETYRLSDERKDMMKDFLSLVRGKNQSSSTDS